MRPGLLLSRFVSVLRFLISINFRLQFRFGFVRFFGLVLGLFDGLQSSFIFLWRLRVIIFHGLFRFFCIQLSFFFTIFLGRLLQLRINAIELLLRLFRSLLVSLFEFLEWFGNFLFGFCCALFTEEGSLGLLFILLGLFLGVFLVLLFFLNLFKFQLFLGSTGSFD